jgi:hypothetical protein
MPEMKNAWEYVQDWDVELIGTQVRDLEQVMRRSRAFAIAGRLPYIWRELARPISEIIYALLEARQGDKILIIGEAVGPAGWAEDLRAIVGETGRVDAIEIIMDGRKAVNGQHIGRNGMVGCWQWTYTNGIPDTEYDCVGGLAVCTALRRLAGDRAGSAARDEARTESSLRRGRLRRPAVRRTCERQRAHPPAVQQGP